MLRKTFRDLRKNWISFLSVFLMSFICLFIFTGIFHLSQKMEETGKQFIKDSQLAESILSVKNFDEKKERETKELSKIKEISHRSIGRYHTDKLSMTLLSFDGSQVSEAQIMRGEKLSQKKGIWLDEDFFKAKKYKLGEFFSIGNVRMKILGTVRQPEFIYHTGSTDQPMPNHEKNGYAYVSEEVFEQLPLFATHQLLLKTKHIENSQWFEQQLTSIWGTDYQSLLQKEDISGLSIFFDRVTQIQRLAFLFSSLFLLLTLITMEATMRRFVKQQQLQIAALKAEGFSKGKLLLHYLSFGMIVTFLGATSGCLLGPKLLTPALLASIGNQFSVPAWLEVQTTLGYYVIAVITLFSMLITLLPVVPLLNKLPAEIMQKQTNQRFKQIWLERTKIWSRLPFSLQWTLRDIQRNRRRAVLGIFGSLGCMLLLIAAFGISDSIKYSIDSVFNNTYHYEETISLNKPVNEQEQKILTKDPIGDYQWMEQQSIKLLHGSKEQIINTTIVSDGKQLELPNINLKKLSGNEIGLSEALANKLNLQENETIYIQIQQQILPVFIKKLIPISSPQGIFFSQKTWQNIQQPFRPQNLLLAEKEQLKKNPLIASKTKKQRQYQDSQQLLEGILMIVSLLVLAALALGITIMMNCHLLIFSERFIEFATLKVLGFTKREVLSLSFLETCLLTITGWVLGLPCGWLFLQAYTAMVSTDQQQYLPYITFQSLAIASLVLLGCMLLVQGYLNIRINRIDFATALKPTE